MVVESLCNSSRSTANSRTAWTTTAKARVGMSASKRRSRRRRGRLAGACGWVIHGSSPDADWSRWWGPAARRPRRHDRSEGGNVKGKKILKKTYVDLLDVNRAAHDLRQGCCRKSSRGRGRD